MGKKVILSFGGNLGKPFETFQKALFILTSKNIIKVLSLSSLYVSKSLLKDNQPAYLNMIALAETELNAEGLLAKLKECERVFGRLDIGYWQPRELDIDIIDFNSEVINSPALTIPHKELANRSFVIIPLLEIIPDYIHPISGKTIAQLKMELKDDLEIKKSPLL
jgi:2-amino-4-hydroxy-6-hydroxymethyldihydropteridine diphosphokinase